MEVQSWALCCCWQSGGRRRLDCGWGESKQEAEDVVYYSCEDGTKLCNRSCNGGRYDINL